jgi:hypothetical protein
MLKKIINNYKKNPKKLDKGATKSFRNSSVARQQMAAQGCARSCSDLQSWKGRVPRDIAVLSSGAAILAFLWSTGFHLPSTFTTASIAHFISILWARLIQPTSSRTLSLIHLVTFYHRRLGPPTFMCSSKFLPEFIYTFLIFSHAWYEPRSSHPPQFEYPNSYTTVHILGDEYRQCY